MATTITNMRCFPLQSPIHGRFVVQCITRALLPGSSSSTLRAVSFEFPFNPIFVLNSPMNAFYFFLARLADMGYGAIPADIAGQIAAYALNQVRSRGWSCGLFLSVGLTTIYGLEQQQQQQQQQPRRRRSRADLVDGHLISNDTTIATRGGYYQELEENRLYDRMFRSFESMGVDDDDSQNRISRLKKERVTSEEEGECCSICLEEFRKGAVITPLSPCSHKFHNSCIAKWLRNKRTCPICRCKCN